MLPHVSEEAACGSVSFPRLRGKAGMGDSVHISFPRLRGKAGMGDSQH